MKWSQLSIFLISVVVNILSFYHILMLGGHLVLYTISSQGHVINLSSILAVCCREFFFLRKQDRDLIYMFPGDVFWGKGNNTNIWEEIAYIYVPEIFFSYLERQSEKKTTNFPLFFILSSTQDHNVKYKQCSNRVMKCWRLSGHLRGSLSGIYILFFKHNTTVCKNKSK